MANDKKGFASPNYDESTAEEARKKGGQSSASQQNMSDIGQKGGRQAQQSGNAHDLTQEERSRGGSESGGNFKNDPGRASEAGKKGGSM